ncbi:NADPH-dependent FMN reductase [Haloplanus sp. GCM10025708]|uniref:NADPH-dependent FMN reductase n=1 Tax=Haloferacaceae TaxID=1644056 RepID=UPI00362279F3
MTDRTHVVAICGSSADDSTTRTSLERVLDSARERGVETTLVDVREWDLPTFDPDARDAGDAPELRETVASADAIVLGTPMYHGSYSSTLKTALDYCRTEEFEGKTVGLLAVAGGDFPTPAVEHLRAVCRTLRAWTLPRQVVVPSAYEQFENGEFRDADIADRVAELGRDLVEYAGVDEYPTADATSPEAPADD